GRPQGHLLGVEHPVSVADDDLGDFTVAPVRLNDDADAGGVADGHLAGRGHVHDGDVAGPGRGPGRDGKDGHVGRPTRLGDFAEGDAAGRFAVREDDDPGDGPAGGLVQYVLNRVPDPRRRAPGHTRLWEREVVRIDAKGGDVAGEGEHLQVKAPAGRNDQVVVGGEDRVVSKLGPGDPGPVRTGREFHASRAVEQECEDGPGLTPGLEPDVWPGQDRDQQCEDEYAAPGERDYERARGAAEVAPLEDEDGDARDGDERQPEEEGVRLLDVKAEVLPVFQEHGADVRLPEEPAHGGDDTAARLGRLPGVRVATRPSSPWRGCSGRSSPRTGAVPSQGPRSGAATPRTA